VWLYFRFNLSHRRDGGPFIEDLLAQGGIIVTHESIRLWCNRFGSRYAVRLRKKHHGYGDTFFIDEVFIKIDGKQHYLWRAVDQDGEVVDVFLQKSVVLMPQSDSSNESSRYTKVSRGKLSRTN
jgi:putative transposase